MRDHCFGALGRVELGGNHQPAAPHVHERLVELLHLAEFVDQLVAACVDVVEEAGRREDLDGRQRGRASDRVAVGRTTLTSDPPRRVDRPAHAERSEWEPGRDPLGHAEHVGLDLVSLDREHLARAPEPTLDLVGDEQHPVLTTAFGQSGDEFCGGGNVATFAHDRLDHDRRDFLGHDLRLEQTVEAAQRPTDLGLLIRRMRIGERSDVHARRKGAVAGAVDRSRCRHRHREMGAAVEGTVEHDDAVAAGGVLGHLHRHLEDLIAGVREEERVDRRRSDLFELRRQWLEQVVGVHVLLGVDETSGLVGDRLHHLGVRVAGGGRSDAGGEVEVLVTVGVDDATAMAAHHLQIGGLGPDVRRVRTRRGHPASLMGVDRPKPCDRSGWFRAAGRSALLEPEPRALRLDRAPVGR